MVQLDYMERVLRGRERNPNAPRVAPIPRATEGEHVAAGWPPWWAAATGESIKGWVPRRVDSFEKLDKVDTIEICLISNSKTRKNASSSSSAWGYTATSRSIKRFGMPLHQSSTPVSIPDWSKIMKEKPKKNLWDDACDGDHDDEDDDNMLPPHKYLARRLTSTQIASFSVCEGVGRT
ncbi:hypothetical protein ACS0TY_015524 [Phlomoides rotata]